ncbi:MAG: TetR/AcrR family transcriptional regulator [Bacteroidota bacterium]
MDHKKRILDTAREMFLNYGYSKTSMLGISKNLGISKKTIYTYFDSKEDLLEKIISNFFTGIKKESENIYNSGNLEFKEKLQAIFTLVGTKLSAINPQFIDDISNNAPQAWQKMQIIKQEIAFEGFYKLLEEGQKKGFVNKKINKSLVVLTYISAIETLIIPSFTKQVPLKMINEMPISTKGIFEGLMEIIFDGITER